MSQELKTVRLTKRQLAYLESHSFLEVHHPQTVDSVDALANEHCEVMVSCDTAEKVREVLTRRLADVGLDGEYELTDEGELLESLIDQFYLD